MNRSARRLLKPKTQTIFGEGSNGRLEAWKKQEADEGAQQGTNEAIGGRTLD
jgi:hypothetical protein